MTFSAFIYEYGLFLLKAITVLAAIIVAIVALVVVKKERGAAVPLKVTSLNEQFDQQRERLLDELVDKKTRKTQLKAQRKAEKHREEDTRPRMFVLDFDGDIAASDVDGLREHISAVLQVAKEGDEVLLRLESGGGLVHAYGLASSQLARLRAQQIRLVIAVDKVAASGGYMMACIADHLIAAPFAIIGSVGVVGAVPNVHEWLKQHAISYEQHTAGKYKRTLTVLGENTDEGREQFKHELAVTHELFKAHIKAARPELDVEKIATGETWYGVQAIEHRLIDAVGTSDDYLLAHKDSHQMLLLEDDEPESLLAKIRTRFLGKAGVSAPFKMHIQ